MVTAATSSFTCGKKPPGSRMLLCGGLEGSLVTARVEGISEAR